MVKVFPALERIKPKSHERFSLVSDTIIEEVLQDVGTLDFGDKIDAPVNVALGKPAAQSSIGSKATTCSTW